MNKRIVVAYTVDKRIVVAYTVDKRIVAYTVEIFFEKIVLNEIKLGHNYILANDYICTNK